MIKRLILIALCSAAAVILLKDLYISKSLLLRYNIELDKNKSDSAKNEIKFRIYYKDEEDSVFEKEKSIFQTIKPSESKGVSVSIPTGRIYGLKFEFSDIINMIFINKISLEGDDKLDTDDFTEINSNAKGFIVEKSKLSTVASNNKAEFVVFDNFKFLAHSEFNYRIFVILLSVFFLFFWKLIHYLARLKILENHSRLDIIFVCIFFLLLLIPVLKINDSEKSLSENRMLAVYDPFVQEGKVNNNYGKNYDLWFNDRFFGREELISLNMSLNYNLNNKLEDRRAFLGKDNWLFFKGGDSIRNYANIQMFSNRNLWKIANYLSAIQNWCDKNNKQFYFLICPDKNKVYGEYYPDYINQINPDEKSRANQLVTFLKEKTKIKIIYPYAELKKHKTERLLYHMDDTHWNPFGAYVGYSALINAISDNCSIEPIDINKISITKDVGYWPVRGQLRIKQDCYPYDIKLEYPDMAINYQKNEISDIDIMCYNEKGKQKIFFFRDSFVADMLPFVSNTFEKSFYRRRYELLNSDLDFIKENYDIIVFEIVERNLPHLYKLKFPDNKENE